MENKSNSLNRIKRHQREKVLRFSIRKYSFGAASVAVAALMFLGARVVSADTVSGSNSQSTAGVVQPNDKGNSPVGIKEPTENKSEVVNSSLENKETALVENSSNTVDKSQLRTVVEELNSLLSTKLNLDDSVLSSVKERVQRAQALLDKADAVQKDINELKELLSADLATLSNAVKESSEVRESNTGTEAEKPASQSSSEVRASEENQTVSAKKDSLKVSVDQLKAAISEVPEHDTTKEVLEKANEVMVLAQGVLQNTTVSLTDVEEMNKLVKRMFNSVKNATTRLTSGARDPRNGQRMARGTGERAATVSSKWNTQDNQLIYQRFRATNGSGNRINDNRRFTENKVDMTARIEMNGGVKYVVYDIFFNNDGQSMVGLSKQQAYRFMLQPKILDLISSGRDAGAYKRDTISDLSFGIYRRNNQSEGGTLSQNPEKFHLEKTWNLHFLDGKEKSINGFTYYNTLGVRATGDYYKDMKDIFKGNRYDEYLQKAVKLEGVHRKYSYGLGVITNDPTAAVHMHLKAKLRQGVTDEEVRQAFTIAVATTHGETTNQSYVFGSGKEASERVEPTVKQSTKYPISGKEVIKKVDEPLGNLDRPVDAGFVTRNDNFPADIQWSWPDGKPSTTKAGVFHYKVKAQYSDNTSNTTDVILKVRPKQPVIDPNSVNEKAGKTEQTVTVDVGNGVPAGSTVTLYSNGTVIGTGKTTGTTATIKVSKALPSTAITARTSVQNVESDSSAPVTPTPERDTQPPTVKMTNPTNNRDFVLGSSENNSPEVEVFRGATLDIPLKMHDNNANGKINIKHISGLPKGVNLNNGNTLTTNSGSETKPATATISGRVATDARLGTNVVTLKASDDATGNVDRGNNKEVKFNIRTYDVEANSTRVTVEKGTTLSEQDAKAAVSKVVGSEDLPNGTTYEWVDSRGNKQTPTPNTAGVNNYRVKVTLPGSGSGTNILNGSSKIVDVPVNVRPETPVVDTPLRAHKTMKIDTVPSTATRLTGTGIPGATIKVKVAGRELPNTVTVGQNGRWELQLTKGLNSNQTNQRQLVPSDPVVVTQIVGGVESSEKSVPVSLGETSIQPSVEGGTTVYAGAKNLVVKAPHDAGMIYVSYRDKATGAEHEIGLKRENIDSPWVSNKSNLGVVTGTTKDAFTNTITIKMNESIAEGTAKAVSNISEGNYSSAVDWKTIPVSNQAPTITAGSQGNTVTVEHGAPVTLKNLVTARDVEDDSQITRGNGVNIEVISVNDSTTTKEINTNQPGVYRVKYKAVDSQGKESGEVVVTVNVRPETPVVDTPLRAHKTMKIDTVPSTATRLTGTGIPGATIKVKVAGRELPNTVTVGQNGRWELKLTKGLNSNQTNQRQLVPSDPVVVTQIVGGVESSEKSVPVSLGETSIQPSVEGGTTVYAGAKNIVVKAPHDAGMIYVSYRDKATGAEHEIGLKRENINSPWVSIKPTLGVVTNTSKDAFTNNITIEMKESIAEGTAKAIANISERNYSSAVDWKTIQVTNQAPTVTSAVSGNEKIVEFGENIDLKTLVTKADYEDDKDATRGTKVRTEIVSVNGQNNVKDINSRKPGTYIVKYKAIDSQGKESGEIQLTVKVREDKPTPPTATAPSDGTVTVTPTGDADKVIVNYTDEKNAQKTVTVVKAKNGTWSSSDKPAGVTVDSSTGQLLIPAEGVKDKSQVTATATKGDSHPSEPTTVTAQAKDFTPVKPDEKVVVQDKSHLTPEEKKQVEDKVKAKNPGKTVAVGDDGTATVTDPSTKISHPIAGKDLVIEDFGVNGIPEVTPIQPEYTGPISSNGVDGNGNLIDPPTVELPEFNGAVNGELPDPVELPKVKLIITKWIDEQGNELKPADAKAPAVLGEANEAFEHGEIEGYVFVRTDVNEEGDVVTHVFRKVTPTKPEGNGEQQGGDNTPQSTPEVPTDNTERKPETEKPTVPDTKQAEQPTQTVDAQVAPSQNQAVLPNTGTKADRATGALGALSLLGAFGLLFAKKKKDDEEETRNN